MDEKLPCVRCGVMIRPITAQMYEGLCAPCQFGIREQLEEAKRLREETRNSPPKSCYWTALVEKVSREGYEAFSPAERLFYCVMYLDHQTFRGGIETFLLDASAEQYYQAERGLQSLGLPECFQALQRAKIAAFDEEPFPVEFDARAKAIADAGNDPTRRLLFDELNEQFCLAADRRGLQDLAERFAEEQGLSFVLRKY